MATEPEYKFPRDKEGSKQLNFNTLLGAIALAVIFWVGSKTQSTSESVAKIETTLPYVTASVLDLKSQIAQLVTRAEMESRFAELAAKNALLDARLMKLEYEKKRAPEERP